MRISLLVLPGGTPDQVARTAASLRSARHVELLVRRQDVRTDGQRSPALRQRARLVESADASPAGFLRAALTAATGEFVAVLAPGDELEPGVLGAVDAYLRARPRVDVLYTDEQWQASGADGIRIKPDWDPTYLEATGYLGRLCLVRRSVAVQAGGFRDGFAGAEEWDLHLRVTALTDRVEHVPVIGVTRIAPPDAGPDVVASALRAVEDRYRRADVPARVEPVDGTGYLRIWREIPDPPLVTVVIPTVGATRTVRGEDAVVLERCLASLVSRTTYARWEVVLVTSPGTPEATLGRAREILGDRLRAVAPVEGDFSFSVSVNEGVRHATGSLVLLLNDDTEVIEPRWLDRMVAVAQDPTVGVVGAKLLFEDDTVQHVGIVHGDDWFPVHVHRAEPDGTGRFGSMVVDMRHLAVTAACMLTRRALFEEVGGFTRDLPLAFNDVDYCYKVVAAGHAVVCTPFARLYHYESSSRVGEVRDFERQYLLDHTVAFAGRDPHVDWRSIP